MRTIRALLLMLGLGWLPAALPLVNPETTPLLVQGWMADIYVKGNIAGSYTYFCRGALIAGDWVLTSARCLYDPYKALDRAGDSANPEYAVKVGNAPDYIDVKRYVQSPDFAIGLMKLAKPAPGPVLPVSTRTAADLRGAELQVLGLESSRALRNDIYQAGTGTTVTCRVDQTLYTFGGGRCYVLARQTGGANVFRARATVVDPNSPPNGRNPLDLNASFPQDGSRLYLDFTARGAWPCHEDIGAPVLRESVTGFEVVGVVSGVGIAAGYPICTLALANVHHSIAPYRAFIEDTMMAEAFDGLCPEAPEPGIDMGELGVRVSWEPVPGASGYKVHYTSRAGYEPIRTLDVGAATVVNTAVGLTPDIEYMVAVSSYNANCSGTPSPPVPVLPPLP